MFLHIKTNIKMCFEGISLGRIQITEILVFGEKQLVFIDKYNVAKSILVSTSEVKL